jgi:hypothetical protein
VFDTLQATEKEWSYDKKGRLKGFQQNHLPTWKETYLTYLENRLTQVIEYDSLGKKYFEWNLDSNQVKPFKDNGLCLYGFVNLKNDTIIPAQYEQKKSD